MSPTALVICGGGEVRRTLPLDDTPFVVAADAGAGEALRLGYRVDALVGDLDSVAAEDLELVRAAGAEVEQHDTDKDATDLELAMERALRWGATAIVVAGGDGGRLDHLLGNLTLLASPRWASATVDAVFGDALVHVVRAERELEGTAGERISLLAMGGPARGVTTAGLRWALVDATLDAGTSLGISNEFAGPRAWVRVHDGVIVAVRPGVAS